MVIFLFFLIINNLASFLATDIIAAFPTETAEDFEESIEIVKKYEFPSLFINQFYPRPGTPAARLVKVNSNEAKRRTREITKVFHSYQRYKKDRIGEECNVLICEMASDGTYFFSIMGSVEGLKKLIFKYLNIGFT